MNSVPLTRSLALYSQGLDPRSKEEEPRNHPESASLPGWHQCQTSEVSFHRTSWLKPTNATSPEGSTRKKKRLKPSVLNMAELLTLNFQEQFTFGAQSNYTKLPMYQQREINKAKNQTLLREGQCPAKDGFLKRMCLMDLGKELFPAGRLHLNITLCFQIGLCSQPSIAGEGRTS